MKKKIQLYRRRGACVHLFPLPFHPHYGSSRMTSWTTSRMTSRQLLGVIKVCRLYNHSLHMFWVVPTFLIASHLVSVYHMRRQDPSAKHGVKAALNVKMTFFSASWAAWNFCAQYLEWPLENIAATRYPVHRISPVSFFLSFLFSLFWLCWITERFSRSPSFVIGIGEGKKILLLPLRVLSAPVWTTCRA